MSEDILSKRGKALEDEFFNRKNQEALERIAKSLKEDSQPVSPITGKPLRHDVFKGVNVFICQDTQGIWVGKSELLQLVNQQGEATEHNINWDEAFFEELARFAQEGKAHGAVKVAYEKEGVRKSPVADVDMLKIEINNLVLDRCPKSDGIWFDANELPEFLTKAKQGEGGISGWVKVFYKAIGYK